MDPDLDGVDWYAEAIGHVRDFEVGDLCQPKGVCVLWAQRGKRLGELASGSALRDVDGVRMRGCASLQRCPTLFANRTANSGAMRDHICPADRTFHRGDFGPAFERGDDHVVERVLAKRSEVASQARELPSSKFVVEVTEVGQRR